MSKILVVDDEENTLMIIKRILEVSKHEVMTAYNGREGLEQATKSMPDLIILDIIMPKMDGLEMLRKVKDLSGHTWTIPVIMLTGVAPEKAMQEAMSSYAECYLTKPIDVATLMAAVTRVLDARKPAMKRRGFLFRAIESLFHSHHSSRAVHV